MVKNAPQFIDEFDGRPVRSRSLTGRLGVSGAEPALA
jgi:hypothetical protein